MDATTHIESRLPSGHMTGRPARAPHRPANSRAGGVVSDSFDRAEISETPYNVPDLKPAGQYVDKELFNTDIIILRSMRMLVDSGSGRGECRRAEKLHQVALHQVALPQAVWGAVAIELSDANLEKRRAAWDPRGPAFGSEYLWTFAQGRSSASQRMTDPGKAVEKMCHADI